jgi:hypothetical protein
VPEISHICVYIQLHTRQVWNYIPKYETTYPGMELHTQVWNCIPRYGTAYPGKKLHTQVWNCIPRYETTHPSTNLVVTNRAQICTFQLGNQFNSMFSTYVHVRAEVTKQLSNAFRFFLVNELWLSYGDHFLNGSHATVFRMPRKEMKFNFRIEAKSVDLR